MNKRWAFLGIVAYFFLVSCSRAWCLLAIDNCVSGGGFSAASNTFSITVAQTNEILCVMGGNDASSAITITYNSVAVPLVTSNLTNPSCFIQCLYNPSTGSNTVSITQTNANGFFGACAFKNVGSPSTGISANAEGTITNPHAPAILIQSTNSFVLATAYSNVATAAPSAPTGTAAWSTDDTTNGQTSAAQYVTNVLLGVTPNIGWTAASEAWAICGAEIRSAPAVISTSGNPSVIQDNDGLISINTGKVTGL